MEAINEIEMFRTVLNEMLTELKQLRDGQKEMNKTILLLGEKVDGFQQHLENLKVEVPATDLQPVKDELAEWAVGFNGLIKEGMEKIQTTFSQHLQKLSAVIEAEPKPIVRRISLFPETDRNGHFKFFISRLILGVLGALLLVGLFSLGQQYIAQRPSTESMMPYQQFVPERTAPAAPPPHKTKAPRKHHVVDSLEKAPVGGDSVGTLPLGA